MATVEYELTYSEQVETVSKIRFSNKTRKGDTLKKDHDPANNKYSNEAVSGVITNGLTISLAVEATGKSGGKIWLKVKVDGKKTVIDPIEIEDTNGVYSISSEYKLEQ